MLAHYPNKLSENSALRGSTSTLASTTCRTLYLLLWDTRRNKTYLINNQYNPYTPTIFNSVLLLLLLLLRLLQLVLLLLLRLLFHF